MNRGTVWMLRGLVVITISHVGFLFAVEAGNSTGQLIAGALLLVGSLALTFGVGLSADPFFLHGSTLSSRIDRVIERLIRLLESRFGYIAMVLGVGGLLIATGFLQPTIGSILGLFLGIGLAVVCKIAYAKLR